MKKKIVSIVMTGILAAGMLAFALLTLLSCRKGRITARGQNTGMATHGNMTSR